MLCAQVEEDIELDQKKLKAALEKVTKHNQGDNDTDERKRKYNSFTVPFFAPTPPISFPPCISSRRSSL